MAANEIVSGMVWRRWRYIQSLNVAVRFEILKFFGQSVFFIIYNSQKPHSNHVFPLFNHSSIIAYVITTADCTYWATDQIFSICYKSSSFSQLLRKQLKKSSYSCCTLPKCSNDKKSILGFSSPLKCHIQSLNKSSFTSNLINSWFNCFSHRRKRTNHSSSEWSVEK